MKSKRAQRAVAGVALCALGFWLSRATPYRKHAYLVDASGCHLYTVVVEPEATAAQGAVVLFPGLSATQEIMSYLAEGFAAQGLRVFVPDLPGHGRTAGPFSPDRAEHCGESLVHELLARGLIEPDRTILAGHSMGGAIAERIAARVPVAGLIAISPAPMKAAHGVSPEMLLFPDLLPLSPHSLVLNGAYEPESMRGNSADLLKTGDESSSKYEVIPHTTHVGLLFSPQVVRDSQAWAAGILHLESNAPLPTRRGLLGFLCGFAGLLLLTTPFLRETLGGKENSSRAEGTTFARPYWVVLGEFTALALAAMGLLHFGSALRAFRLFQGDYFATFLLILGIALLFLHAKKLRAAVFTRKGEKWYAIAKLGPALTAAFTALVMLLLFSAWMDLSFTEAWLTGSRWARFPALFAAVLPYHLAEEFFLTASPSKNGWRRLAAALTLRLFVWLALLIGIFYVHSGEILLVLLAPYFALFSLLQRRGMDIVRTESASPLAAAIFGAILLTGFCLMVFPIR
jgi:pimeloyl-ACP methyl ester carboxylesterase